MHLIKKLTFVGGFAALTVILGACGNKGPLYLPAPITPAPPTGTVPAATTTPATPTPPSAADDNSRTGAGARP